MPEKTLDESEVRAWATNHLAEFLGRSPDEIEPHLPLQSLGLDSVDTVLIGGALEERFDVEIDATLFLRNDSIDAIIVDLKRSGLIR